MTFEELVNTPAYSLPQAEKEAILLAGLNDLTEHHYAACAEYRRIIDVLWGGPRSATSLSDLPFLPVSIFKALDLISSKEKSFVLASSGTTGQQRSRIFVDSETSARQSRALISTFKPIIGEKRLPLLVIDTKSILSDPKALTARGAGVLGLMKFGAKVTFALEQNLEINESVVRDFLAANGNGPFLIFGFTFLVWTSFFERLAGQKIDLSNGTLIHSGGWKQMEARKISNAKFRERFFAEFKLERIYNFYGMVEQIGSLFVEASDGNLYPPNFSDVIIRDPHSWAVLGPGEKGIIQVVSTLPLSYPGHSLLTEDIGEIVTVDAGVDGRRGKAIRIHGRLPRAELRGCSDVLAA